MQTPDPLKVPKVKRNSTEAKNAIKAILKDLELRRQALGMKIPLARLEKVYKFTLK